jgi:hypothetical protein
MSILVGVPVHAASTPFLPTLFRCWSAWRLNLEFLIVVNGVVSNALVSTLVRLRDQYPQLRAMVEILPSHYLHSSPSRPRWRSLWGAQVSIRQRALDGGYSHLLWHEASRIPAQAAIATLLAADQAVCGALYKDSYHPGYYCVYEFSARRQAHRFEPYFDIDRIVAPQRVAGIGFGFTLLRRDAFEAVRLRYGAFAADTYFAEDAAALNVPIHACPAFVDNAKVNHDVVMLRQWMEARQRLSREFASPRQQLL